MREALQAALQHGVFGYELPTPRTQGDSGLGECFRLYGWEVSPEAVVPTPGIVAGFKNAARAFCTAERGVVVQPPVYPPFLDRCTRQWNGPKYRPPGALWWRGHVIHYELDWDAFETGFLQVRPSQGCCCFATRTIPPGVCMHGRIWSEWLKPACGTDTVICSDEIHSELLLGGRSAPTHGGIEVPKWPKRTITLVVIQQDLQCRGTVLWVCDYPGCRVYAASYCKALERGPHLHVKQPWTDRCPRRLWVGHARIGWPISVPI